MPSKLKTALVAGTVTLAAALGAAQAAQAGGRHLPFVPIGVGAFGPSALHDDDDDDDTYFSEYSYSYRTAGSVAAEAVDTASSVAEHVLGVDAEDLSDLLDE